MDPRIEEAATVAWKEIAESASEFLPGTQEATSHVTALEGINKGLAMLEHPDETFQMVGYAQLRWTFYALQKDALFPSLEYTDDGVMRRLRALESALESIENGAALDMRRSAGAARMELYSAISVGHAQVIKNYARKMRNTCDRYGGPWSAVSERMQHLLDSFGEEA